MTNDSWLSSQASPIHCETDDAGREFQPAGKSRISRQCRNRSSKETDAQTNPCSLCRALPCTTNSRIPRDKDPAAYTARRPGLLNRPPTASAPTPENMESAKRACDMRQAVIRNQTGMPCSMRPRICSTSSAPGSVRTYSSGMAPPSAKFDSFIQSRASSSLPSTRAASSMSRDNR